MFFISLSNNREYFSKQKFNRYINPYPYYSPVIKERNKKTYMMQI